MEADSSVGHDGSSNIKVSQEENQNTSSSHTIDEDDDWLIRPCDSYNDEYKDCKSFKARFHQYFVFGEFQDCNQWKKDSDNCYKWLNYQDHKAKKSLIQSESERRQARMDAHYNNKTWRNRKEPPKDWNKPLPEWLRQRDEHSYLTAKSQQLKGEESIYVDPTKYSCSIS